MTKYRREGITFVTMRKNVLQVASREERGFLRIDSEESFCKPPDLQNNKEYLVTYKTKFIKALNPPSRVLTLSNPRAAPQKSGPEQTIELKEQARIKSKHWTTDSAASSRGGGGMEEDDELMNEGDNTRE